MKKSLIALAVLAASGVAMAQSSVTLYGVVDAGFGKQTGSSAQMFSAHRGNKASTLKMALTLLPSPSSAMLGWPCKAALVVSKWVVP